jgi:aquaporin Z
MKKYIVEFIGTFFLVLTVGLSVRSNALFAPLAIGSILMVMIFSGGHISGGHFNPAVTLAVWLRGRAVARDVVPYWLAQLLAGVVAALVVNMTAGKPSLPPAVHDPMLSLTVEFLFTFALAWAVLNTATAKGTANNSFYGLAIGFTVFSGAIAVGGISGAAFNPAVGLGVFIMGLESLNQLWIYIAANLLGGAAAAVAFKGINGAE